MPLQAILTSTCMPTIPSCWVLVGSLETLQKWTRPIIIQDPMQVQGGILRVITMEHIVGDFTLKYTNNSTSVDGMPEMDNLDKFEFLFIWSNSSVSCKTHINTLLSKIRTRTGFLYCTKASLTHSMKYTLVKMTILPILDDGDVIQRSASKNSLNKLDVIHHIHHSLCTWCSFHLPPLSPVLFCHSQSEVKREPVFQREKPSLTFFLLCLMRQCHPVPIKLPRPRCHNFVSSWTIWLAVACIISPRPSFVVFRAG